jgi:hypothetical protein
VTADAALVPDDVNCELDRPQPKATAVRASDLLIGAAALLPVVLKLRKQLKTESDETRAA